MIEHIKIQELISADYDGQASAEERRMIEEHLQGCVDCRKYAEGLSKLSAALRVWPDEGLSPDLERKIRMSLPAAQTKEGSQMKTKSRFITVGGGGLIVAFLVLVVSMQVYTQRGIQGRRKGAADNIGGQYPQAAMPEIKSKKQSAKAPQYEPYYRTTEYAASSVDRFQGQELLRMAYDKGDRFSPVSTKMTSFAMSETNVLPGGTTLAERSGLWNESLHNNLSFNTEQYNRIYENEFMEAAQNPLSTFSIDVDTASYSNVRRFLNNNQMPPRDAVRIEEMINYFSYDYPKPAGDHPFSITTKAAVCPWEPKHQLVLVGLQGKTLETQNIPPSNLVFLVDVSGSMDQPDKLPLLKSSFRLLVNQLRDEERAAIVVYAGNAGLVLESTLGSDKQKILEAVDNLQAGGSTAGGAGIQLAYKIARENFIKGGNNRVVLATDGDFNVGVSSDGELTRIIEEKRKDGIFLTVLGFGTGNYKDSKMEQLADKGNGNYYYIDTLKEGKKVLVSELGSTLFTIAKDVKIQIEFNPSQVKAYRLVGYENRILAKEDFNDDTKDAGELGAGHTVTAMYEIVPVDSTETNVSVDKLAYQKTEVLPSDDLMTVKLRYKDPDGETSKLIQQTVKAEDVSAEPAGDFQFASVVAEFGLILRDSKFKGNASYEHVLKGAGVSKGKDPYGYRAEFIELVGKAQALDTRTGSGTQGINFKGE
ncbi:MAG: von Willebrand factor type A domain-containing protein [Candidatus Omnitrophica bacterium]|nr:von Willebrand factor type A domain-containing protein [Candidatus Omnitrophota bacterium]